MAGTQRLSGPATPAEPVDPEEIAYRALHAERAELERALALEQHRQRFCHDAAAVDDARDAEAVLLKELDRTLTMIRAAEIRRHLPQARRWR